MAGFENPLWRQVQKIKLDSDGTMRVPAAASAEEGIVIGEPPIGTPVGTPPAEAPTASGRRSLLARLQSLFR